MRERHSKLKAAVISDSDLKMSESKTENQTPSPMRSTGKPSPTQRYDIEKEIMENAMNEEDMNEVDMKDDYIVIKDTMEVQINFDDQPTEIIHHTVH